MIGVSVGAEAVNEAATVGEAMSKRMRRGNDSSHQSQAVVRVEGLRTVRCSTVYSTVSSRHDEGCNPAFLTQHYRPNLSLGDSRAVMLPADGCSTSLSHY